MADPVATGINTTLGRDYIVPPQFDDKGNSTFTGKKYMTGFDILMLETARHTPVAQPDWYWNPQA